MCGAEWPTLNALSGFAADVRVIAAGVVMAVTAVYCLPWPVSPLWCLPGLVLCLWRFRARIFFAAVIMAVAWTLIDAQHRMANRLPVSAEHTVRPLVGRVIGLPEPGLRRTRFMLAPFDGPLRRVRLSWYDDPPPLIPGDCVRVAAKLSTPHGSANPGGFDYADWLWRNHINATGYVRHAGICELTPIWTVDRLRALALRRIDGILANSPVRGIVEALTLGVRQHITDAQWATLRATGTSHLVAISGLHIGLIAALLFVLARWLALRWPTRLPADAIAAGVAFAGAVGYAAMAGWALPTQRALIMVAVGLFAVASAREIDAGRALAMAAIAVVFWQPAAVTAAGFWLSFAAVAWLIFLAQGSRGPWWRRALRLQLGLVIALMPLTLWFFDQASIAAPGVNAVLIPAAGVFVPLLLLTTLLALLWPTLGAPLLQGLAWLLAKAWPALAWLADWPAASFHHVLPGTPALLLALIGMIWLFAPRGFPARWLAAVLLLPLIVGWQSGQPQIAAGGYRVTVLDVGQGLASVVRTRGHTLIFDTGPAYPSGFDAGAMIVVPYLRHVGRKQVDTLVLSHGDLDHAGGAPAIEKALSVRQRRGAKSAHPCRARQRWQWDGVAFEFLSPTADEAAAATSTNARSCVLRIAGKGGVTLFTGDIEAPGEADMVDRVPGMLRADVLVVAHHGSRTSSSQAFLEAVGPRLALISAGWYNRWGFPAPAVTARLRAVGATIANTATGGALTVRVPPDHGRLQLLRWRATRVRFWQQPVWIAGHPAKP